MKYWLIGLTAALSLMAMAPERSAHGATAAGGALSRVNLSSMGLPAPLGVAEIDPAIRHFRIND